MIDHGLLGLLLPALLMLRAAVSWRMRRTGALDRPPPQIDGRRIFRPHPALPLAMVLSCGAVAADMFFSGTFGFIGLAYAALAAAMLLWLGLRFVLSGDHLEMQIFGQTLRRIALSSVVWVRPAGFFGGAHGLILYAGRQFPLPAEMAGVSWLIDRVTPRNDPAMPRRAANAAGSR